MRLPLEVSNALDGWRLGEGALHQRLAVALAAAVERQELLPGARLPPERLLAAQLGVARTTVSAAYGLLARRRLVQRHQGRGTHVSGPDGTQVDQRGAELATSLQRNLIFGRIGERPADAIELLGSAAPPSPPIRAVLAAAVATIDLDALLGDHGYFPLGYPPLRRAVAAHLITRGLATVEEEILITGGAQQAISLLAACYVDPGAVVLLEDPTFPGAIDAVRTVGGQILTVPVNQTGTDLTLLAATIAHNPVRAVYLMPTFHNPTGTVMPDEARRELARICRTSQLPIIEDNTLAELGLGLGAGQQPPRPLAAYAAALTSSAQPPAQVISIGSLSKLYWGGLRVGWIRGPRSVIARLGRLKAVADLGTSLVSQAIAVALLADVDRVAALRRHELTERLAVLEDLLQRMLPDWRWRRPQGGLSLWARLPDGNASAAELAQLAARRGVLIAPGVLMSPTGRFDNFVRLPFDHHPGVLEEGIRRLAAAWAPYRTALDTQGPRQVDVIV